MSHGPYLALVLLLVAAVASVRQSAAWRIWPIAGALAIAAAPGLKNVVHMWSKLSATAVFAAILVLTVLWRPPLHPGDILHFSVGPLKFGLAASAVRFAALVAAKTVIAIVSLTAAYGALGDRGLLVALQSMRLPCFLVASLFLTLRYMHASFQAAAAARMAAAARGEPRRLAARAALAARIAGVLVLRGVERSERIGWAMVSRGFSGALPALPSQPATAVQWLFAVGIGCAAVLWVLA
ncbi:MAG: hypothetical protein H5T86_14560 [Armatimonadetes bacterium]|nr:hypothetical protein [Armatimonadota bacterium]